LREIYFGQWEGLAWKEIEQRDSAYAQRWIIEYPNLPAPDGEDFRAFERRALDEVKSLAERARDRRIAVVTHAGMMRTVLCRLCGCSEEEARQQTRSYCCIVRYKIPVSALMQSVEVAS
jgi:broad specificity phosphatase PhoE